jgi:hypothetical protein
VFPDGLKGKRDLIIKELKKATYGRKFRERLTRTNDIYADPVLLELDVARARKAIEDLVKFHDLTI